MEGRQHQGPADPSIFLPSQEQLLDDQSRCWTSGTPLVVETYLLELLEQPKGGDPFDRTPPPELQK